jgi:DNA-directed RNA polymerase subunit RPC12/RpoP
MTKRYQLGKTTWTQDDDSGEPLEWFTCNHAWSLPHHLLVDMGATPLADKPECDHEWDIEGWGGCCFKCRKFWTEDVNKPEAECLRCGHIRGDETGGCSAWGSHWKRHSYSKPEAECEYCSNAPRGRTVVLTDDYKCRHCGKQFEKPDPQPVERVSKEERQTGEPQPEAECDCATYGKSGWHEPKCSSLPQPVKEISPISQLEIHNRWSNDIDLFMGKINELINGYNQLSKAVNSLKGEE